MIGTTIQNYRIETLLGEGGMGRVYLATDTLLGRTVAIKNLNASLTNQPQFLERFKNEAQTLARLSHPNIALLYNYLQNADDYFMVMEYVEGENLDQLMRRQKTLPYQLVVPVMYEALEGLEHAHKKGILHRDLKPANIMITPDSNVKLMDFGIAKVSGAAKLTQVSRVIGTLEFLAPELIEGNEPSEASDIYAIGVTMYELLSGRLPFTGKSDYMLMQEIIKEKPKDLAELAVQVPAALTEIISKSLEKNPADRFANARSFKEALKTAFPNLNEINVPAKSASAAPKTVLQSTALAAQKPVAKTTVVSHLPAGATRVEKLPGKTQTASWFQKFKIPVMSAAVLLIGFILYLFLNPSSVKNMPATNQAATDTISTDTNNTTFEESSNTAQNTYVFDSDTSNNNAGVQNEADAKPNTAKPGKESTKTNKDKKAVAKPGVEKQPKEPEKPVPPPVQETPAPTISQTIKIGGHGVPVTLVLQERISLESATDGQSVSFKVVRPVELKGSTIIPAGSVVHGTVKSIGRVGVRLVYNSVVIRGRSLSLNVSSVNERAATVFASENFVTNFRGTINP